MQKMYDVLQQLDMEDAYVLHSLGLPKHQSKIYGESFIAFRSSSVLWLIMSDYLLSQSKQHLA